MADGGTWLVLVRDVSSTIRVQGESHLDACLVLEVETGLIRGAAFGATEGEVLAQALTSAFNAPPGNLAPGHPDVVQCGPGFSGVVARAMQAVEGGSPRPQVVEVDPPAEAEDLFDSLIGHMAGRSQPEDLPGPDEWGMLYSQTLDFYRSAPWERWHDGISLALDVTVDGDSSRYATVVMGNAGVQRGLVLYPGETVPDGLDDWQPGQPVPTPAGTLLCTLDPPDELPAELRAKACRYSWPSDAELLPAFLRPRPDEDGGDPSRLDVQMLTVALAAVTAHDARGPVLARPESESTAGIVSLSGGRRAIFSLHQQPTVDEPVGSGLRVHPAGYDLVPNDAGVVLGHLTWPSLARLRGKAHIHRPFPPQAPRPAGKDVPLFAILPAARVGEVTAAKAAELDPYGVSMVEADDGQAVFVLAGTNGAEVLMEVPLRNPSVTAFRRRLRQAKGLHVVMVADEETSLGDGSVYGLFECYQPPPPGAAPRSQSSRTRRRKRSGT